MTNPLVPETHEPPAVDPPNHDSAAEQPSAPGTPSRGSRLWDWTQMCLCIALTGGVLAYLLWTPATGVPAAADSARSAGAQPVRLAGPKRIYIQPDTPLSRKLEVAAIEPMKISSPALNVTGVVAASLRPGKKRAIPVPQSGAESAAQKQALPPSPQAGADYWQFNSSELLTAFTDWQKATADISFAETQLAQIRQLADTRTGAQQKLVARMKKLVEAGTDTPKDLAAAETELIQSQIQGRKEVHEAETAVRLARRAEAALARQLQQAGLDGELLQSTATDVDIVMADVPEGLMSRVKLGQGCEARFFGFPDQVFAGKVRAIAPVLSKERRSLRVLFAIADPVDQLRPGMFADIGLGTDARDALLAPPEGVVHVGRGDYMLVRGQGADWQVTEVQLGEVHPKGVEIVGGLRAGDQVAGRGAILLKPFIIEDLQSRPSTPQPRPQTAMTGGR